MEKTERTELSSLGEFGLIEQIALKTINQQKSTIKGIGDDAAVIDHGTDKLTIWSTDILAEGIHFDLSYTPLAHLGYKAVAVNVSDIAAMNGIPTQITVGLALSNRFSVEAVEELYVGIRKACEAYKVDLVGGDTTSSKSGLMISIGILGQVDKDKIAYRSTAKENDLLCISGDIAGAYIGLQILEREKQIFISNPEIQPDMEEQTYAIGRQLKPEARMDIIHELAENNIIPTSMIDVSDGLASEILHICTQSGVGARIFEDKLPLENTVLKTIADFNMSSTTCMLNGGEDYELLFTIPQSDFEKIKKLADVSVIGFISPKDSGVKLVTPSGKEVDITAQGWVHFKN